MARRTISMIVTTLSAALVASACSSSPKTHPTLTVTVDPPVPSTPASTGAPSGASTSATPTGPPPKPPKSMTKLPGRCDGKLPLSLVGSSIGETLPGQTAFVVGKADPSIHRVTYINCRYGLSDPNATPIVEIQVSLYGTASRAAARIAPTVNDYKDNGATAQKTTADQIPATILTGGTGAGYDTATLILAFGQRTVAVSLSDQIATDKQTADLTTLAALAVKRTQ